MCEEITVTKFCQFSVATIYTSDFKISLYTRRIIISERCLPQSWLLW